MSAEQSRYEAVSHALHLQRVIYDAVAERGYRRGWDARTFLARQVLKLVEELAEAAAALGDELPGSVRVPLARAGEAARAHFNGGWPRGAARRARRVDWTALAQELADMQVVLVCAAQALAEVRGGEPLDLLAAAAAKARGDIRRGVRGG